LVLVPWDEQLFNLYARGELRLMLSAEVELKFLVHEPLLQMFAIQINCQK